MKTISYGITVCNEINEIKSLLSILKENIRKEDEIIILFDKQNGTKEVEDYLNEINTSFEFEKINFHRTSHELNNDFASFKNFLKQHCSKDYIFQIDADEFPSKNLLENLPIVLDNNQVDVYLIPRVNAVEGLTEEWVRKWGWRIDDNGRINWPDYQMRILKNTPDISWVNKVHEILAGYKSLSHFPIDNHDWVLYHPKKIERQIKQNEFYEKL